MNEDFITVKELSERLNVSVQTIYKYLNEIDKEEYTRNIKNKTHISPTGVNLITSLYEQANPGSSTAAGETNKDELLNIELMARYIDTLEEQIKIKDEQIRNKDELLSNLAERLRENNIMLYSDKVLEEKAPEVVERKTLLERIKAIFTGG